MTLVWYAYVGFLPRAGFPLASRLRFPPAVEQQDVCVEGDMSIESVLAVLDAGLQSSPEIGYGTDSRGLCARCQRHEPADGDICSPCRAFLLGDVNLDPRGRDPDLHQFLVSFSSATDAFVAALAPLIEAVNALGNSPVFRLMAASLVAAQKDDQRRARHARWQAKPRRKR